MAIEPGYLRSLGGMTFTVVVQERETSEVTVTDHPIESGASISDHAYIMPQEVSLEVGQGVDSDEDTPRETLRKLKAIQAAREPVEVYTGKSYYPCMVITSIEVTTDNQTEQVLMANITCREVVIVETKNAPMPKARQKKPRKTQQSVNKGTVQAKPSSGGTSSEESLLYKWFKD